MKIYKSGNKWAVGSYLLDAGTCYGVVSADGLRLEIKIIATNRTIAYDLFTNYENETGVAYTKDGLLTFLDDFFVKTESASSGATYTPGQTVVKKVIVELARPADTTAYTAGDLIGAATVAVKKKDTITLSGALAQKQKNIVTLTNGAPVKQKQTISFAGTAPTKQKETVTITGSSGTFNVTMAGNLTKLATYHTSPTVTAEDFVTDHAAAYLGQNIVVTSDGADLIFEAYAIGQDFVAPEIVQLTGNLAGSVAHTTAAVPITEIDLMGSSIGFALTIDDAIATALATFVTNNATSFLGIGVVLTSDSADLILEAETAGTGFTEFVATTESGNIVGTSATTQANVLPGAGMLGLPSTLMLPVEYDTDLTTTAAAFASDHAAAFDAIGVAVTASTTTIIFEAKVAGVAYEKPVFQNTAGTLAGAVADTTANRVTGTASISCGGVTKTSTFVTNATTTAAAFVTANSADYSAIGIAISSSGADLIFEASAAGQDFTSATITNLTGSYTGTVVATTANTTLSPLVFSDVALTDGGGGILGVVKVDSNITAAAAATIRLWFFSSAPSTIVGDNVAFTNAYGDSDKMLFYVDVELGALLGSSNSVTGQTDAILSYITSGGNDLYCLAQTLTGFTPTSGGMIKISATFLMIA